MELVDTRHSFEEQWLTASWPNRGEMMGEGKQIASLRPVLGRKGLRHVRRILAVRLRGGERQTIDEATRIGKRLFSGHHHLRAEGGRQQGVHDWIVIGTYEPAVEIVKGSCAQV